MSNKSLADYRFFLGKWFFQRKEKKNILLGISDLKLAKIIKPMFTTLGMGPNFSSTVIFISGNAFRQWLSDLLMIRTASNLIKIQLFIILLFCYRMKIWRQPIVGHVQTTFVISTSRNFTSQSKCSIQSHWRTFHFLNLAW